MAGDHIQFVPAFDRLSRRKFMRLTVASIFSVCICQACSAQGPEGRANLDVAEYTAAGELVFPADVDQWIHLGSSLGGGYAEEVAFAPEDPGLFHITTIEPAAYRYLIEHKEYADGTMLLLSFYNTASAPEPKLNGFVQGNLVNREIHVIDRSRFAEERGFFLFGEGVTASPVVPAPNQCLTCHAEHARFDGTFTQFYPSIRELVGGQ
jgi:hypothetical protein